MKRMWVGVFVLAMALAMAGSTWGQAQITTGVIQGTVLDATGAVVPGATVEVKNLDTNFTRTLTTNEDGRFVALQLPSGRYEATITKSGFAKLVQQNISLTVGQSVTLTVNMKVAPATETVTVTATPTVDTIKTEMSSTLNDLTVTNTPILGRKVEDLLTLTPGVGIVQGPDGDEITFSGQRGIFNNFSVDGGDFMNGFFGEQAGGQRVAIDITLEAVKE
ncbi:MAG: carboxypeptidase regulatory-like domain-containing protein, partial [Acidobacteria bacterium]|nr:carboxypeptidase regulatory-like domain-containing protein [Acidobacteriota bacterium]